MHSACCYVQGAEWGALRGWTPLEKAGANSQANSLVQYLEIAPVYCKKLAQVEKSKLLRVLSEDYAAVAAAVTAPDEATS